MADEAPAASMWAGVDRFYGSYEELLQDEGIHVVGPPGPRALDQALPTARCTRSTSPSLQRSIWSGPSRPWRPGSMSSVRSPAREGGSAAAFISPLSLAVDD